MSNPLKKVQEISGSEVATSHDLTYLYGGEKPNAATQIGEDKYTYDMNGNPTLIENDSTSRQMRWDEENRITMVNDDGYVSRYTYDHAGVRTVKSHGPLEGVAINGAAQGLDYHDKENYTIYVSPYMTVTADRFTKHYYAGTQRIASKIGSGDFDNVYGVESFHLTAGQKDYADRLVMMESGVQGYYKKSGIPPGPPTNKGQNADPYATDVALPNVPLGDYSVPSGWPTDPKFNAKGDVPGPPAMWQPEEDLSDPPAGYGFTPDSMPEKDIYFFHSDHLGSTSYLTDTAGNVTQFVWYSPYGESIIDEHTTSYENPFKFSGKELDDVTGLYDHGARSRNPVTTLWLGVDPLYEIYTTTSPYSYCAGNPIKFADYTGMNWVKREVDGVTEIYYDRTVTSQADLEGDEHGATMLNDGDTYAGYTFYNDHKNNKNGKVMDSNGNQVNGKNPIRGKNQNERFTLFVGVGDNCVDAKTLHNNYMGTSYTGPNNPRDYANENWNYDYIPYNIDEFGSIKHDLAYDDANTAGATGALFDIRVIQADKDLVIYNLRCADDALMYSPDFKTAGKCVLTAGAFSAIVLVKTCVKSCVNAYNSIKSGYSELTNSVSNIATQKF